MGLLLYRLSILLYRLGIFLVQPWNEKARQWIAGRHSGLEKLQKQRAGLPGPLVWMHCASLGEFEQGRPILEAFREKYPEYRIALSFFSPSGYEVRKNYTGADLVFYLPTDSPGNASRLLQILQPRLVLWVKYEYWYFHLRAAFRAGVPILLCSAIFRDNQVFFRWYGGFHRTILGFFARIFVQDDASRERLLSISVQAPVEVAGDTRFDRVLTIQREAVEIPDLQDWIQGAFTLVVGSSWPEDEEVLDHFVVSNPSVKCLIAPHEVGEDHIKEIEKLYRRTARYSVWKLNPDPTIQTLIIDSIGLLSRLYRYADVAFLGGGYGAGIHNVLEAAAYGKPILFGPNHEKFREALDLIDCEAAFCVENALEAEETLYRLKENEGLRSEAGKRAAAYVAREAGATDRILDQIENLLRTS